MTLRAYAEAIYQGLRAILGDHDAATVQTKLERELRHVLPNWTADKPGVPGWYWYKPPGIHEPKLLLVSHGRIDTKLMADLGPPSHLVDVARITGQWAGPLLPPD